jgi:hypothetical protein
LRYFGPFSPQLIQGGLNVVAHQVELVMALPAGKMHGKLGRRKREDEPARTCVGRWHPENVSKEAADLLGLRENTTAWIPVITPQP